MEIHHKLQEDYERWTSLLNKYSLVNSPLSLSVEKVLRAHYLLCDYFLYEGDPIAIAGPRDINLFLSAVDRQTVSFGNRQKWNDIFHVVATLFFGIIKNHPFHDGNKRTALLCALYSLWNHGRIANVKKKKFETLALRTASNNLSSYSYYNSYKNKEDSEIRVLAHIFKKYTRREDKRYYRVTYRELSTILKRFNFDIEGPHHNKINIVKIEQTSRGIFFRKKDTTRRVTIYQVGCPRITAQINPKALKEILKACGLIAENGYDSSVIFQEYDPLGFLIDEFQEVLKRLKDK